MEKEPFDFITASLHFTIGGLLGALIGLKIWSTPYLGFYDSAYSGMLCIGISALIGGVLGAISR